MFLCEKQHQICPKRTSKRPPIMCFSTLHGNQDIKKNTQRICRRKKGWRHDNIRKPKCWHSIRRRCCTTARHRTIGAGSALVQLGWLRWARFSIWLAWFGSNLLFARGWAPIQHGFGLVLPFLDRFKVFGLSLKLFMFLRPVLELWKQF